MTTLGPMLLLRLRTICKTVDGKFYPIRLIAQTLPLLTTICSGRCITPSLEYGSHQNGVSIILASFILGRQAGAVLLGWDPQIARKMGKSHSFKWTILWIKLLYMYFLNKRSNFEKKNRTNQVIDPIPHQSCALVVPRLFHIYEKITN